LLAFSVFRRFWAVKDVQPTQDSKEAKINWLTKGAWGHKPPRTFATARDALQGTGCQIGHRWRVRGAKRCDAPERNPSIHARRDGFRATKSELRPIRRSTHPYEGDSARRVLAPNMRCAPSLGCSAGPSSRPPTSPHRPTYRSRRRRESFGSSASRGYCGRSALRAVGAPRRWPSSSCSISRKGGLPFEYHR
jgi:hypothetical protein